MIIRDGEGIYNPASMSRYRPPLSHRSVNLELMYLMLGSTCTDLSSQTPQTNTAMFDVNVYGVKCGVLLGLYG